MQDRSKETVYGPYKQGAGTGVRWRVVIIREDGVSRSRKFKSSAAAESFATAARGQTSSVTMRGAVDAYIKSLVDRGLKFATYDRAEDHLVRLLQLAGDKERGIAPSGDRLVTWVARRGADLYEAAQVGAAPDSHRNALAAGKSWGRFCVRKGWLSADPFGEVVGQGRRRKGKPQLYVDEARKLTAYLLQRCTPQVQAEAVAVLTVLLLGTRASEVIERDVRDLDDGGTLLWIPDSKTPAGRRVLEVPELLQPLLRELARDRIGAVPLFRDREGARPSRHWTLYWCKRLCQLASVPVITAQGFRGTHGSIARRGGATGRLVQEQLGHASLAMTEGGAYVRRDAVQAADARAVELRILKGGRS